MNTVEQEDSLGMARLGHPAGQVLVFKRNDKKQVVTLRKFQGSDHHISNNLRLKGAMFNHHMPWGYNGLFEGHGAVPSEICLEQFEEVLRINNEAASLYPNLKSL